MKNNLNEYFLEFKNFILQNNFDITNYEEKKHECKIEINYNFFVYNIKLQCVSKDDVILDNIVKARAWFVINKKLYNLYDIAKINDNQRRSPKKPLNESTLFDLFECNIENISKIEFSNQAYKIIESQIMKISKLCKDKLIKDKSKSDSIKLEYSNLYFNNLTK